MSNAFLKAFLRFSIDLEIEKKKSLSSIEWPLKG